jgi:hypothetical protein
VRVIVEVDRAASLPSNTLQVSHSEKHSRRTGVHSACSGNPDWTVDSEGGSQEVGFLGLSLSCTLC